MAVSTKPAGSSGNLRAVIDAVLRSVNPRNPGEAAIVADEITLSRGSSNAADFALPLGAALVAFVCRAWIAPLTLILWVGAVTVVSLGVWVAGRHIEHLRYEGVEAVRKWARTRTAMTALYLGTWSAMGIFLWAPGELLNHMFIILVLASSLAASSSLAAPHPATALVAIVTHGAVMVLRPLFAGSEIDLALAGLCLIFCFIMASQARVVYVNALRARQLQFEREELIRNLSEAKKESDREHAVAITAARARAEFLSNLNHELRTPMNAILGFSELIQSKVFGNDTNKYVEYSGLIHQSGQHLLMLINDMLDLARIEGGKLSLRESCFNLGKLMGDMVEEYEPTAIRHGLTLSLQLAKSIPIVEADERAVRQILVNLLSNAVKFTQRGGHIIAFAHIESDGRLAFGVDDSGIGIAPEDQVHVFERFGRGRHDVAAADRGTGLGLAIVKGFAMAHDGEVSLESDIGAGTRVTIHLPASRVVGAKKKKAG